MKLLRCLHALLLAVLLFAPDASANNETSWSGFILLGNRCQFYSASLQTLYDPPYTEIHLINSNNEQISISVDDDESGNPDPVEVSFDYLILNNDGMEASFLPEGTTHTINRPSGRYPVYYLLSYSFHRLLNRITLNGKSVSVHLINPLSPDNSADFHLQLNQTGNSFLITAHPINAEGQVLFTNNVMVFHSFGGINWSYYIQERAVTIAARALFYRLHLFRQGNITIAGILLTLFTGNRKKSQF